MLVRGKQIDSRQNSAVGSRLGTRGLIFAVSVAAFIACSPNGEDMEVVDLIADRQPIELQWEEESIDLGSPNARRHLAAGWNPILAGLQESFVWTRGDESRLDFDLVSSRDLELVLRCRCLPDTDLPPQEVSILIGNEEVGRVKPGSSFADHSVRLPAERLRAGRNTVVFRYSWARSPKSLGHGSDWRRLAIAVQNIEILGSLSASSPRFDPSAGCLTLPEGSAVQWALSISPGTKLAVEQIDAEFGHGSIVVSIANDGGQERELARWIPGTDFVVDFPRHTDGPVRVIFRHLPGKGGDGTVVLRGVRLKIPTKTATGESNRPGASVSFPELGKIDKPNVVIYLVDALRADHLGVYGYARATSPRIDAFAEQALVFDQAWANSSWTRPAVASILTGLRPEVHRTNRRDDVLPNEITTLPELLRAEGYQTAAIVANPNISAIFGFDRGFDEFSLLEDQKSRSVDIHEAASLWLSREREELKPFFLYLHTVDPHLPYDPPEEERRIFAAGVERRDLGSTSVVGTLQARHLIDEADYVDDLIDLYDGEIAANDRQFGRLLDVIDDLGLSDRTIIIFLADHGEEFFDHGGWIHGTSLYSEVLRIPLIIKVPGRQADGRTAMPVQQADLMPTILGLLGMPAPSNLQGRNIVAGTSTRGNLLGAFLDLDGAWGRSVIDDGWHAIQHGRHGHMGLPEIYRLESDPAEKENLARTLSARPAVMLGNDRDQIRDEEDQYQTSDAEVDAETRKQLQALGYL
ncbi:MAG: hypothetical protein DRJ65_08205 [Acidobacteria bacterium]|nr:MAG: hypothetical protein DRJ65_08205 [Acidobacteriota bacterium]